jgi:DNA-binding transcriptional MerR regulator
MDNDMLIAAIAVELGIPGATVRKWRQRGAVPHRRRDEFREQAATRGRFINREAFDNFGRQSSEAAA